MKNRVLIYFLIVVMMFRLTGCSGISSSGQQDNVNMQPDENIDIEKSDGELYGENGTYTITRSDAVILDAEVDFKELGQEYYDDAVELYQDEELHDKIYCRYDVDEDKHTISLLPPENPILNVSTALVTELSIKDYEHSDYALFDKGAGNDWGNLGRMYLVRWIDLNTGEQLQRPEVTEVEVRGELATPGNLSFDISEYGNGILSWEPVDNAEWYLVVRATYRTDELSGYYESCDIVAETKDTTWQSEKEWGAQNYSFAMPDKAFSENEVYSYGVIALGRQGTSMISTMIPLSGMAKRLPYSLEEKGIDGEDVKARYSKSVGLLSRYQWVRMCDDSLAQYPITYHVDEAEIVRISDVADVADGENADNSNDIADGENAVDSDNMTDGDIEKTRSNNNEIETVNAGNAEVRKSTNNTELENEYSIDNEAGNYEDEAVQYKNENNGVFVLQLPYSVDGTEFDGHFYVEEFDRNTYKDELSEFEERQRILKSKMSGLLRDVRLSVRDDDNLEQFNKKSKSDDPDKDKNANLYSGSITATTELSVYIAESLLNGKEHILISDKVNDKVDKDTVTDAFYEAYFQNPLILGIDAISLSEDGDELFVIYEDGEKERERKQTEVVDCVELVASELLNEKMTETDKVFAINSYLCDHVEYDYNYTVSLESDSLDEIDQGKMEESTRLSFGDRSDSMNVYGALLENKGVCTAYAGAFKLLAEEMGLSCIVVTGTINGNQKHAWNKVEIDGKWYVVDVTTNDSEDMKNTALNLSDVTASYMLKEDDRYICEYSRENYEAELEDKEYYHLIDCYYEKEDIAYKLVDELTVNKRAVLRTEPGLDNAEFYELVQEVMQQLGDVKLKGYYRLGVVFIERE